MQAAVFYKPGDVRIEERPTPTAAAGQVLVAVHACGVCGTDRHVYEGAYPARFPVVPGHEFAGTIVDSGPGVAGFATGDRIAIDPNIPCGECFFCRAGKSHFCIDAGAIGTRLDGGFAPFVAVPASQAYKLPDAVTLDQGAMVEPLACAVHGIDRARISPGASVAVLGAGAIGLLMIQLARAAGASKIIVSELQESRRELARALGADLVVDPRAEPLADVVRRETEYGVDVAIEAAGVPVTARQAFDLAQPAGTVLIFGCCDPEDEIAIRPYDIYRRELTIVGTFVNPHTMGRAIQLLAAGQVKVDPFFTHRLGVARTEEAMALHGSGDAIKILIDPNA
ncbi:MAG TPA: zinc-dependent alcohol dehydrogenase family protein [Thermomicrobiales bacterium]|nr:zinc-dependent alcohol dehydrogenase family protein [Thermomicrobiales bacterium]